MKNTINKNAILESNGMTMMDFLEKMLNDKEEKTTILNSISFYFAGNPTYISDWRLKYRKDRIKEEYSRFDRHDKNQTEIYREISEKIEREFIDKNIGVNISWRVVRHAIESA